VTGKDSFGGTERELLVGRGIRQLRVSVGVEETAGNKVREAVFQSTGE